MQVAIAGFTSWCGSVAGYPSPAGRPRLQKLTVLTLQPIAAEDSARIEAVDPAIRLIDAGGWFDGEYRETWPAITTDRYLAPGAYGRGSRAERDALLAEADVILGGWPYPLDLRARATRLKWFHQRPAGPSNLLRGDLWGSGVTVTTSRGFSARICAPGSIGARCGTLLIGSACISGWFGAADAAQMQSSNLSF
jgi:hypothetical protein